VYNAEKNYLNRKIKKLTSIIFPSSNILDYKYNSKRKRPINYMEKIYAYIYEYNKVPLLNWFSNNVSYYLKELIIERDNFSNLKKRNKSEKDINILNRTNLIKGIEKWIDISIYTINNNAFTELNKMYYYFLYWVHISKEYKIIKYYKILLNINNAKFKDFFLNKLTPLISKIYNNKEIQFNIVNLKTLYLNSDIFTQIIALKLKNRDNRLLRVLRSALYMVKLPKVNIIKERYHKTIIRKLWINKIQNLKVNSLLNNINNINKVNKDVLDNTLLETFSNIYFNEDNNIANVKKYSNKTSLLNFLLKSIKHKSMGGVRLEAKGRLTRRFTASRSMFKIKWKGGIRNIDSSYRGLSAVMLRGHRTSNIQYSNINSKTRNGAFGLKGWVASK
jgi:hypothetical protein